MSKRGSWQQGNGARPRLDPRFRQPPSGIPLIGQRHNVTLGLATSDGQPPTVIEGISAIAQLVLRIANIESDTDRLAAGGLDQADMMGDVEATLVVMRAACEFRRVLLEQQVALAERSARRQGQAAPAAGTDQGTPDQPSLTDAPRDDDGDGQAPVPEGP